MALHVDTNTPTATVTAVTTVTVSAKKSHSPLSSEGKGTQFYNTSDANAASLDTRVTEVADIAATEVAARAVYAEDYYVKTTGCTWVCRERILPIFLICLGLAFVGTTGWLVSSSK